MNIADLFRRQAAARPLAEAFRCRGERFTWADVDRRSDALASTLAASLDAGDRLAIIARNCHRYWEVHAACAKAGVVAVPINHRLTYEEISAILGDVGARALVLDRRVPIDGQPGTSALAAMVPGDALLAFGDDGGPTSYEDAATRPVTECVDRRHPVNVIGFTSGTTGRARGAILSQRTATMSALWFANLFQLSPSSTFLACMPAYVYRGQAGGMAAVVVGATIVPLLFEAGAVLDAIEGHRVTHAIFAPAMVDRLLAHPDLDARDLSSLEGVWIGGAPSSPETVRRLSTHVRAELGSVYGMTEATGIASTRWTLGGAGDDDQDLSSVGRPGPLLDVRLVDGNGADVPTGDVGELIVSGDSMMDGYWGEPPGVAFDADGWYHTGDLARRDGEGRLFLVDRRADVIVSGGLNVYAAEVERVLATHPDIAACAVVSAPDRRWGETVCAVVVPAAGAALTLADVQRHCAPRLARYKHPRRLAVVDELPANTMGKIDKRRLRDQQWAGHARPIG